MEKKSINRKTLTIVLGICIVAAVVAVAGLFGYTYMADHNTLGRKISVSGLDVSRLTAEQAEEKIISSFENRTVVFQENDQQVYSTTLKNLGYSLNKDALLEKLNKLQKQREENRKLFPKEENVDLEYQIKQDEEQEKQAASHAYLHSLKKNDEFSFQLQQNLSRYVLPAETAEDQPAE